MARSTKERLETIAAGALLELRSEHGYTMKETVALVERVFTDTEEESAETEGEES